MKNILLLFFIFIIPIGIFAQTASYFDGIDIHYYENIHETFEAVSNSSIDSSISEPVEIILYKDFVLDKPLIIGDNIHIRLITSDFPVTIQRGIDNLDYPLFWINGENASLTLGKPDMIQELFFDGGGGGGESNEPPIIAHSSLIAVMGSNSKLIMYDNVFIQNNYNNGMPLVTSYHKHGSGIFLYTPNDMMPSEFIMKGGTIRGNTNNVNSSYASGGGVLILENGIFTMEGGIIMNNTAQFNGGGFFMLGKGTFKKTGGIIYGIEASAGLRNIVLEGAGSPKIYGHSVCIAVLFPVIYRLRNDTVKENDNLTFYGSIGENGTFGEGEKWDTPNKTFQRNMIFIILPLIILCVFTFLIIWQISLRNQKKLFELHITQTDYTSVEIDFEKLNITPREKQILELLLTDLSLKQIAYDMKLTYSGAVFHTKNLYRKLGIHSRAELFVKFGKKPD